MKQLGRGGAGGGYAHHSQYDSTSQHKNYTLAGVKELRPKLYEAIARDQYREKLVASGRMIYK